MRVRLRYVLPIPQMFLAGVLLIGNNYWWRLPRRGHWIGNSPQYELFASLNPPVTLLHGLLVRLVAWFSPAAELAVGQAGEIALVLEAGLLWYLVGNFLDRLREHRPVARPRGAPVRIAFDVTATAGLLPLAVDAFRGLWSLGLALGIYWPRIPGLLWPNSAWLLAVAVRPLWPTALILVLIRDAVLCWIGWRRSSTGRVAHSSLPSA
jgi:hypothetical protein